MPLFKASFFPLVATPAPNSRNPIEVVRIPGTPPAQVHYPSACVSLSGLDAFRFGGREKSWTSVPPPWSPPLLFLVEMNKTRQSVSFSGKSSLLPAAIWSSRDSGSPSEKLTSLFKGRVVAEFAPAPTLFLFWITKLGPLALVLHGLDPFPRLKNASCVS